MSNSKYSALLLAIVAICVPPQVIGLASLAVLLLLGFLITLFRFESHLRVTSRDLWAIAASIWALIMSVDSWSNRANDLIFFAEAKISILLLSLIALNAITRSNRIIPNIKALSLTMIALNFVLLIAAQGSFRFIDKISWTGMISIYMSVVLSFIFIIDTNKTRRAIILGFILWLGSSTGIASLMAGLITRYVSKNGLPSLRRVILVLPISLIFVISLYFYALDFRGRDLLDIYSIDRFQLTFAGINYIFSTADASDFLFGYGVGQPLSEIYEYFPKHASVVAWLLSSRASDGFTGLAFHNDFLRVFVNFGIIGSVLIWTATLKSVRSNEIRSALLVASLVNSTIYINSIFLFAIFCDFSYRSSR
ncbi:hypothetical protein [Thioclava sp. F1Mire-8]|uniref:hypothetical protein n=1 Tax=Thioclava sp. F1Mire-8 TaxID=1973006 RepID=UPI0011BD0646|nr:hypothetical protein [Thioclava sp. F1Mire-8]